MTMKVHVTGVAGLIGSHLARFWLDADSEVSASDDFTSGYRDNVDPRAELFEGDCGDLDAMIRATKGAEVVYHCAASPHEGLSVFSPHTITKSVFGTTVTVTTACIINKVRRLVSCSSMARYGSIEPPFHEEQTPEPEDPYGIAKLAAEQEVALLSKIHGLEYVIAVPHNVVGPGQRYDDPYRNVVAIMINRCLQGKPPIIYGDGKQMRCFSNIVDAVAPLSRMAWADVSGETINIGPDENFVTINHLAELVMRLTGFDGEPLYMPPRPQEVRKAYCSSDKARRLLEYRTTKRLEQTVQEMVDWIRLRGVLPFDYYLPLEITNEQTPKTWSERLM
jgi:UDP-glucose 4-epimerase